MALIIIAIFIFGGVAAMIYFTFFTKPKKVRKKVKKILKNL